MKSVIKLEFFVLINIVFLIYIFEKSVVSEVEIDVPNDILVNFEFDLDICSRIVNKC